MTNIAVTHNPSQEHLIEMEVFFWPIWTKEISIFRWTYDCNETCYFLEGDVAVTPDGGAPVTMGKGDLVTFPAGMSCTWEIRGAVKKHYSFD